MLEHLKFQARVQGAEIEDSDTQKDEVKEKSTNLMVFGDPKDYERLSEQERKDLTDKMKGAHQRNLYFGK